MTKPLPTQADYEMYDRYVAYFRTSISPYTTLLPFKQWFALRSQCRPGGPSLQRDSHLTWQTNDIVWVTEPTEA